MNIDFLNIIAMASRCELLIMNILTDSHDFLVYEGDVYTTQSNEDVKPLFKAYKDGNVKFEMSIKNYAAMDAIYDDHKVCKIITLYRVGSLFH